MKNLLLLIILLPCLAWGQAAYDRPQITQWLQDGAWDDILASADSSPDADSFLLQSAGYASYQSGDKTKSAGYYNRLLILDSNNRQALYYTSVMLKAEEEYEAAIPLLQRLCRIAPAVSQYHVLLADCYSATEERTAAARHLKIARSLSPASPVIANKLANAWIKLKAWDSAGQLLNQAMSMHPREPILISTAISLAYTRKQYVRASALSDSLILTGKMRYESLIIGLYADIAQPNYPHAIQLGNVMMALGSATEEVLYYTALAYQKEDRWREADTLLRKCVAKVLKPNLEAYYLALADGAAQKKDWARCKAYYDTAYYLFKNPTTLYRKGLALQSSGRKEDAQRAYKRYLALPLAMQDTAISHYLEKIVE